ncbi:MAG: hypothetical protein AB8F94_19475 [Saprospiraceae bacterium]
MKKFKSSLEQENTPKPAIKINVFYLIAFQLFGFALTLLLEYQPIETSSPEIHFVFEKAETKANDIEGYQMCKQEKCRYVGP